MLIVNGKSFTEQERLEYLKVLSAKIRDQVFQENQILPSEIDVFLELLKIELKYLYG